MCYYIQCFLKIDALSIFAIIYCYKKTFQARGLTDEEKNDGNSTGFIDF